MSGKISSPVDISQHRGYSVRVPDPGANMTPRIDRVERDEAKEGWNGRIYESRVVMYQVIGRDGEVASEYRRLKDAKAHLARLSS